MPRPPPPGNSPDLRLRRDRASHCALYHKAPVARRTVPRTPMIYSFDGKFNSTGDAFASEGILMIARDKPIQIACDDQCRVTISSKIQPFHYVIRLFPSDGAGGFLDGQVLAMGGNTNPQFTMPGAGIQESIVQVCVTHGGQTGNSSDKIVAQLDVMRSNGQVDQVKTLSIPAGLESPVFECFAVQFR